MNLRGLSLSKPESHILVQVSGAYTLRQIMDLRFRLQFVIFNFDISSIKQMSGKSNLPKGVPTDKNSLELAIQNLRDENKNQKETQIAELNKKYGIIYQNFRWKHDEVVDRNGKTNDQQLTHFLKAACKVKDMQIQNLKDENKLWRRFCAQIFGWSNQSQQPSLPTRTESSNKYGSSPRKEVIKQSEGGTHLKKEMSKYKQQYEQTVEKLNYLTKQLNQHFEKIKVDIVKDEFQEVEQEKSNEVQKLQKKVEILVENVNENEDIIEERNSELNKLEEELNRLKQSKSTSGN